MGKIWKKGRGKLGFLEPIMGRWVAEADSPMGPLRCTRSIERVLGDQYIQVEVLWQFGTGKKPAWQDIREGSILKAKGYQEIAILGVGEDKEVCFWSFTSDGKRSQGKVCDVSDVHPEAFGFEAQMPAGIARMIYWPNDKGGFFWAVEAKNKKGWKRFTQHEYRRIE